MRAETRHAMRSQRSDFADRRPLARMRRVGGIIAGFGATGMIGYGLLAGAGGEFWVDRE